MRNMILICMIVTIFYKLRVRPLFINIILSDFIQCKVCLKLLIMSIYYFNSV